MLTVGDIKWWSWVAKPHRRIPKVPALGKLSRIQWKNGSVWKIPAGVTPKRHPAVLEQYWLTLCTCCHGATVCAC